jgi:hypothetical protein
MDIHARLRIPIPTAAVYRVVVLELSPAVVAYEQRLKDRQTTVGSPRNGLRTIERSVEPEPNGITDGIRSPIPRRGRRVVKPTPTLDVPVNSV